MYENEIDEMLEDMDLNIETKYPISGVNTDNTNYTAPEKSKEDIKERRISIKEARKKDYPREEIEEDLKILSTLYEEKNSPKVKELVQKYGLHNKAILKTLLNEKAKEYNISKADVKEESPIMNEDIEKDSAKLLISSFLEKLALSKKIKKESQEAFEEAHSLLNGGFPNSLDQEKKEKFHSLLQKHKLLDLRAKEVDILVDELKGKVMILMDKYKANTFKELLSSLKLNFDDLIQTKHTHTEELPKDDVKKVNEEEKSTEKAKVAPTATPVNPTVASQAPIFTASSTIEKEDSAKVEPLKALEEVKLPSNSDLSHRKVEGNKFSYYAPIYDNENNITGYQFKEVDIDKEYLDDPSRAYKLALKEAAKNKALWKNLNCENEKDIKKMCKELQKDFSKTLSHFNNYDECLKRILTVRSAITPEELEKAVVKGEYYDKSKYEPVSVVAYDDKRFNMNSISSIFRGIFGAFKPDLISLKINESLPAAAEKETYKWPNPETGELETLTRHRRMDRYKNKSKKQDKDKDSTDDIEP